jgi:hypothetical protein
MKKKIEDKFYDKVNYYEVKNQFTSVSNNIQTNSQNFCEFGSLNVAGSGVWKSINNLEDLDKEKTKKVNKYVDSSTTNFDNKILDLSSSNKLGCKKCGYSKCIKLIFSRSLCISML